MLGYGFLFAIHSNYGRIFSHFAEWPNLEIWVWGGVVQGHLKWRGSLDHVRLSIGPPL